MVNESKGGKTAIKLSDSSHQTTLHLEMTELQIGGHPDDKKYF